MDKKKVILYGCGKRCQVILDILAESNMAVVYIIDSNSNKWGEYFGGYVVSNPSCLLDKQINSLLCITVADEKCKNEIRTAIKSINNEILINEVEYFDLIKMLCIQISERYAIEGKIKRITSNIPTVLFDCYFGLGLGGIEEWTKELCTEFVRQGREKSFIITSYGEYDISDVLQDKIIFRDVIGEQNSIKIISDIIKKNMPCTVITSQLDIVFFAACMLKKIYPNSIRIISVVHGGCEENYMGYPKFRESIDLYIGVSEDIQNALRKRGVNPQKTLHMTCPIKSDEVLIRKYTTDCQKPLVLGYAGRIEIEQKRIDLIIKLICILEEKKINYKFKIAGEGRATSLLNEFINNNSLNNKVNYLGKIDRLAISDFWKSIDVCINVADYEGRSISIMEAMANGAVPIVTHTSGVKEDITDNENGFIVPVGDVYKIAEKVEEVCSDRSKLKEFGEKSHDIITSKSKMCVHIKFWNEVLNKVWL